MARWLLIAAVALALVVISVRVGAQSPAAEPAEMMILVEDLSPRTRYQVEGQRDGVSVPIALVDTDAEGSGADTVSEAGMFEVIDIRPLEPLRCKVSTVVSDTNGVLVTKAPITGVRNSRCHVVRWLPGEGTPTPAP